MAFFGRAGIDGCSFTLKGSKMVNSSRSSRSRSGEHPWVLLGGFMVANHMAWSSFRILWRDSGVTPFRRTGMSAGLRAFDALFFFARVEALCVQVVHKSPSEHLTRRDSA